MALTDLIRDVGGIDLLQRREVKLTDPVLPDKASQQVADHPRIGEERLVGVVDLLGHPQPRHFLTSRLDYTSTPDRNYPSRRDSQPTTTPRYPASTRHSRPRSSRAE